MNATHRKGECPVSDDCEGGDYCYCDEPCDCGWTPPAPTITPLYRSVSGIPLIYYLIKLSGYRIAEDRLCLNERAYIANKTIIISPATKKAIDAIEGKK